MSISVTDLEKLVMSNVTTIDEIIIISGYFSIDMLEKIAKQKKKPLFIYVGYSLKINLPAI